MATPPLRFAVVGAGRAGQARIRALGAHPRAALAAVVRRVGEPDLADVLADSSVDGLLVCTPNALHAEQVDAGLAAGKHVGVEYPLAPDAARASQLFERARAAGRVLHVEHIELLAPSQEALRRWAEGLGRPRGGRVHFTGGSDGWIGDELRAGSPALRALARLHRLVDLFGPAHPERAQLERSRSGYRLEVELEFVDGGRTRLIEERAPGLSRATSWRIPCEAGELGDPPQRPPGPLFERDLDCLVARILDGAEPYVSEARIVHVLDLVGQIERRVG